MKPNVLPFEGYTETKNVETMDHIAKNRSFY